MDLLKVKGRYNLGKIKNQFQVKIHILSVKIQIIVVYTSSIQTLQTHCLKPDYIVGQVLSINW